MEKEYQKPEVEVVELITEEITESSERSFVNAGTGIMSNDIPGWN